MKTFTTPGIAETRLILRKKLTKARRHVGRCHIENIRAKLDREAKL